MSISNLEAIRKWSMTQDDWTTASNSEAMSEERKIWLKDAMESLLENTAQALRDCAETIMEPEPTDDPKGIEVIINGKMIALDNLRDRVEDLDNAKDLHKVGGLVPVIIALRSQHSELRWRAADALGTCVQNNIDCQNWAYEHKAHEMLTFLSLHEEEPMSRTKALYAISCLTRGHPDSLNYFLTHGAVDVLSAALREGDSKSKHE